MARSSASPTSVRRARSAVLGLFTRPVAFLLSGEMAVAYFHGHAPKGFWPVMTHGDPAVLFRFVWLYLSAAGPGPGASTPGFNEVVGTSDGV